MGKGILSQGGVAIQDEPTTRGRNRTFKPTAAATTSTSRVGMEVMANVSIRADRLGGGSESEALMKLNIKLLRSYRVSTHGPRFGSPPHEAISVVCIVLAQVDEEGARGRSK